MLRNKRTSTAWIFLLMAASFVIVAVPTAFSQDATDKPAAVAAPAPAPFPAQIAGGKRVFIANHEPDLATAYNGGPERPYDSFYAAMKSWGHYELVFAPNAADLVFEIRLLSGHQSYDEIRVTIRDPKSNVALWTLYQSVEPAFRGSSRDKNLEHAMEVVVYQLAKLAGTPLAAPPDPPKP